MKHQKHYKRFLFLLAMLLTVTFAVAQTDERTKSKRIIFRSFKARPFHPSTTYHRR